MSRLHGLLSAEPLTSRGVTLARGFGQYQLHLPSDVWIDLEVAASAVDRAEGALRMDEPGRVLGPATFTTTIARRVFLAGVDGTWVNSQRARLERQLLRGLDCLAQMWLASGDPGLAVETALEAVAIDTFRERSYQLLMQAYAASGNAAEAVRVYHRLREVLDADLGTEPSPETEAVYRAVLQ